MATHLRSFAQYASALMRRFSATLRARLATGTTAHPAATGTTFLNRIHYPPTCDYNRLTCDNTTYTADTQ